MELASIEVVKRLVALEFGISVVPRIAVEAEVAAGTLHMASLTPRAQARELGVVIRRGSPLQLAARKFVEIAREVLDSPSPTEFHSHTPRASKGAAR